MKNNATHIKIALLILGISLSSCTDGIWIDYYEEVKEECQFYVPQRGFKASTDEEKLWTAFDYVFPEELSRVTPGTPAYDPNYRPRAKRCLDRLEEITAPKWAWGSWKKASEGYRLKVLESLQAVVGTPLKIPDDGMILGSAPIPDAHLNCIYNAHLTDLAGCVFRTVAGRYAQYFEAKGDSQESHELYRVNKSLFNYMMNRIGVIKYDPDSGSERGGDGVERIFLAHFSYADRAVSFSDHWWNMDMEINSPYRRTQVLVHETRHAELSHTYCDLQMKHEDDKNCDKDLDGAYGIGESYGAILFAGSALPVEHGMAAPLSPDDISNVGNRMCRDAMVKFHDSKGLKDFFRDLGCAGTGCCSGFGAKDYLEFSGIDTDLLNLTPELEARYERGLSGVNLGFRENQIESCSTDLPQ